MERLQEKYINTALPKLKEEFGYDNIMATPKIQKATVNVGLGRVLGTKGSDEGRKTLAAVIEDLSVICGQRAVATKARKSISGFKIRQGQPMGVKVTLRGERMYSFLERLVGIALPRTRDFRGLPNTAVDQNGNLTIGIKEHIVFPEIAPENVRQFFGLEVTVTTTGTNREEGLTLFRSLGFPIKGEQDEE